MFPENETQHQMKTRKHQKFEVEHANTKSLQNSAIIYMLLNAVKIKFDPSQSLGHCRPLTNRKSPNFAHDRFREYQ